MMKARQSDAQLLMEKWKFRFLSCVQQQILQFFHMSSESEIIELGGLKAQQILEAVQKLVSASDFERFTVVLKRKPKTNDQYLTKSIVKRRAGTKYSMFNSRCQSQLSCKSPSPYSQRLQAVEDMQTPMYNGLRQYYEGCFENALEIFKEEEKALIDCLKQGVETVKDYHDTCFHIGNCYYRMKSYQKAIEYFSKKFIGQDEKQRGQKYNNLGSCFAHLDQPRLSLSNYAEALKIYSEYPQVDCSNLLNNLGMLYAQSGMYDTAQKYFLQSIQQRKSKSPENSHLLYSSYLQLGNCQKHSQKYTEAISSLQLALNFAERGFGDESQTLFQLASIYQLCQKWTLALDCYQKLSQKQQQRGFLFERAAAIHRHLGRHADHDRFIKKAFEQYQQQRNQRKLSQLRPVVSRLLMKR